MDGRDLSPVWQGERQTVRETLFTAFYDTQRAVRDGRWKLIRYPRIHFTQLFDLASDPFELHNLAENVEHEQRVADMMHLLESWQARMGDPKPLSADEKEPMAFDYDRIERRPDRWQPEWVLERYFHDE